MAMASFSSHSTSHLHGPLHGHAKITKARSRQAVKPILKKLQSHSHSEKNSLDLDRSWDEQARFGSSYSPGGDEDYAGAPYGASYTPTSTIAAGHIPRPVRDVSFSLSATDYSHTRSTSGTSHISVATSTSGRNGSFVHPFQQTPRTSTPPLSYANSLASLDNPTAPRDYSPTITEDDDDIEPQVHQTARSFPLPHSSSQPRRPSLASQRTSSLSDINHSMAAARRTHRIVTKSRSDLHLHTASTTALDSASSASPPASFISPQMMTGASSASAMSPLRTSLDVNGFRLRSRSEVDTASRQDHVREARRKFEEKERAKEEKYAREQIRKQERAESKGAHRLAKSYSHGRKTSFGGSRISCDRTSSQSDIRPSVSRKNTATGLGDNEKVAFESRGYHSVPTASSPRARTEQVHFESTRRNNTAKQKTNGAWTAFVLWFRTRLLKMGRR
ncbi:hypothetical protein BGZ61DRAFT_490643 [Ilyonectria robusta]|uniref:uncharacterized protein n=1 Tax=Ilyonectria robusta TaxID=1079257 RepID=UPI001E8DBD67|nr:uncharacterized protein BGZ61DRAFT_490643 [Ilyonectria robusta]KAH8734774.1 hypothetical protein BGZ61DRAFT_490643 [Ilyonectria robusta]